MIFYQKFKKCLILLVYVKGKFQIIKVIFIKKLIFRYFVIPPNELAKLDSTAGFFFFKLFFIYFF